MIVETSSRTAHALDAFADVEPEAPPLVAHLSLDPAERIAVCGAPILGIPAFGDFVHCGECDQAWDEWLGALK